MRIFGAIVLVVFVTLLSTQVWALEELTDEQLHAVTAGSQDPTASSEAALTRIPFRYSSAKARVDGEVLVVPLALTQQTATLKLTDNAQSHLRSMININAVNSPIQILLNLNINVNSKIGNINQWNQLLSTRR